MLKISASNFGPIIEGTVELKPLTVFVGPNNAGKSYMAMLIYSLLNQDPPPLKRVRGRRRFPLSGEFLYELFEQPATLRNAVIGWLKSLSKQPGDSVRIVYEDLPNIFKPAIDRSIDEFIELFAFSSRERFESYFGAGIAELRRNTNRKRAFHVNLAETNPHWKISLSSNANELVNSGSKCEAPNVAIISTPDVSNLRPFLEAPDEFAPSRNNCVLEDLLAIIFGTLLDTMFEQIERTVHYIPAARSGILQGHKLLASLMVRRAARIGVERLEFATLPGVVSDFISELLIMETRSFRRAVPPSKQLHPVAHHLETTVLRGEIALQSSEMPYPEIRYRSSAGDLPLVRTSSMVSEMAPIVLWLKHVVNTGDLLILEEPESHLHPASQRRMAEALAMLVRRGVQVLITTHSDYLLSQLTNLTRLGALDGRKRSEFGYGEDAYLKAKEIGAYWFDLNPDVGGTRVKELPITVEDGIPEDSFTEFVENLYDESVRLQHLTTTR